MPSGSPAPTSTSANYENETSTTLDQQAMKQLVLQPFDDGEFAIFGKCPRCFHETVTVEPSDRVHVRLRVLCWAKRRFRRAKPKPFDLTVVCRCLVEHPAQIPGKIGCGAYWCLKVNLSSTPPTLTPADSGSNAFERARAEQYQDLVEGEVERMRSRAANYRTALAAMVGLIATVSLVKGNEVITNLPAARQWLFGILLVVALVLLLMASWLSLDAAYGWKRLPDQSKVLLNHLQSHEIKMKLNIATVFTLAAIGALGGAVGLTWYG